MLKIELVPNLEYCVETLAKNKLAELTRLLLDTEAGNTETEDMLETIRLFLETADFKKLRAASEKHLVKGKNVRFMVYLEGDIARWEMQVIG